MHKGILYGIPLIIALLLFLDADGNLSSFATVNKTTEKIISLAQGVDVANADAGTLTITLAMPLDSLEPAEKILIFESRYIAGLKLSYDVKKNILEGGVPFMQSIQTSLFDGNRHVLVYSYDRQKNAQAMTVDGKFVAMGHYLGQKANAMTGAVVRIPIVMGDISVQVEEWSVWSNIREKLNTN